MLDLPDGRSAIPVLVFTKGLVERGGEIVPAAERGLIECAEWASPVDDMKILTEAFQKKYGVTVPKPGGTYMGPPRPRSRVGGFGAPAARPESISSRPT